MPNRPCTVCGTLTRTGSRCAAHQPHGRASRSPTTRAQRDGTGNYERNRLLALKRDHWTCHWCGSPADTVDHVQPIAHGGTHALSNLVGACRRCNSRRGGRLAHS